MKRLIAAALLILLAAVVYVVGVISYGISIHGMR